MKVNAYWLWKLTLRSVVTFLVFFSWKQCIFRVFFFIVHFILFNIEKPQSDSTKEAEESSPEFKQQEEGKYKIHGLLLYLHVRVVFVFTVWMVGGMGMLKFTNVYSEYKQQEEGKYIIHDYYCIYIYGQITFTEISALSVFFWLFA
jgi:hypothetical protein